MASGKRVARKDLNDRQRLLYQCLFIEMYEIYIGLMGSNSGIKDFYSQIFGDKYSNVSVKYGGLKKGDMSGIGDVVNCLRKCFGFSEEFYDFNEHLLGTRFVGFQGVPIDFVELESYADALRNLKEKEDLTPEYKEMEQRLADSIHDYVNQLNGIIVHGGAARSKITDSSVGKVINVIWNSKNAISRRVDMLCKDIQELCKDYDDTKSYIITGIERDNADKEVFEKLFETNKMLAKMSEDISIVQKYYENRERKITDTVKK
ncbi:MAG: hypothetical protein J6O61_08005 [Butyrivibrio sp.]|uniref:hypothetical protein n=1 Tax=Butyrivibrio sp. TaxID=28121 RepID=UPI001B125E77|nr:hypothetical protein [Butyrivibrio sp.]MBO6240758.1 hypothetical protein [Butyrivibrio sp.]